VILQRCFAWGHRARPDEQDGPLWVPRAFQGDGRHDNPDLYGCLYLTDREISAVVEQLAPFRTQRLQAALLRRRGLPLTLAALELDDAVEVIDLDDPRVLVRERLRPSAVATRRREVTNPRRARCTVFVRERLPSAGGRRSRRPGGTTRSSTVPSPRSRSSACVS
jgi:hypothetical protein